MSTTWRTRVDPRLTALHGCGEMHAVSFQPLDDCGGPRCAVTVPIPEASNKEVADAIKMTALLSCRLLFLCDTRAQAAAIAERAGRMLPDHRRVPYERAEAGEWGLRN